MHLCRGKASERASVREVPIKTDIVRQRVIERQKVTGRQVQTQTHTHSHTHCERERQRERQREDRMMVWKAKSKAEFASLSLDWFTIILRYSAATNVASSRAMQPLLLQRSR